MDAGPGQERGARSKASGAWAAVVASGLAGLLALGFVTAKVGNAYPVSSDDATGVLEAASILEGNLLLRGWTVSNVSFVTTDLPFYVAGVAIRGLDPSLLREVPSAVYATLVGFAVVLAASGSRAAGTGGGHGGGAPGAAGRGVGRVRHQGIYACRYFDRTVRGATRAGRCCRTKGLHGEARTFHSVGRTDPLFGHLHAGHRGGRGPGRLLDRSAATRNV